MSRRANLIATLTAVMAVALGGLAAWRLADEDDPAQVATAITMPPAGPPAQAGDDAPPTDSAAGGAGAGERASGGVPATLDQPAPGSGPGPADEPSAPDSTAATPPAGATSLAIEHPADAYPVIWVRHGRRVEIRTEPDGGELVKRADRRTEFGSPTVFGVVRRSGDWAGVTTPSLPNDRLGWVRLDPNRLRAGWTELSIVVDVSQRRAELRKAGEPVRSFAVTVGMPGSDTPTGRFAVTDTFRDDLNPAYGCCAVALSATQPNLPSGWLGGRRIAIHGTSGPLGVAASHGCVRAANADVSNLVARVDLGTPVFIRD